MLLVFAVNPFAPDLYQSRFCWKVCVVVLVCWLLNPYQAKRSQYREASDLQEQLKRCCLSLPLTLSPLTLSSKEAPIQKALWLKRTAEEMLLVFAFNPFTSDLIKQRGPHTERSVTEENSWRDAACLCRYLFSLPILIKLKGQGQDCSLTALNS